MISEYTKTLNKFIYQMFILKWNKKPNLWGVLQWYFTLHILTFLPLIVIHSLTIFQTSLKICLHNYFSIILTWALLSSINPYFFRDGSVNVLINPLSDYFLWNLLLISDISIKKVRNWLIASTSEFLLMYKNNYLERYNFWYIFQKLYYENISRLQFGNPKCTIFKKSREKIFT